ncbi:YdcF family protein [Clostridium chromiireducens]|uniref:YdcF family protein n=1 Tax=Clostridium chromiireducens TaxID=225345 RepID=A0A399INF9_9CLOT|nr:YdcF family protein [Clostridium chromiireducens]RII34550.1 YdcF family protein [Clostridium chromiireducens]
MKKYLDAVLGVFLISYIISINLISDAKVAFSFPILILGILLILFHFLRIKNQKSIFWSKYLKIAKILMYIGLIFFLGIEAAIITYPKNDDRKSDYIIVLGAGLANKTTPSTILKGRLDAALDYLKDNNSAIIVLSGGRGSDENIPESHAMSKYLQEKGVDKSKIIIEDKSRDTNENFKYSKEKIEGYSKKNMDQINVKIITTDFHALRSSILAKKNGFVYYSNYSSSTVWYLIPVTYTREAFAIVKSILFD